MGTLLDMLMLIPQQKTERSDDLRNLYDTINECVMLIKNIGISTKNWDALLIHIVLHKLSSETIKNYECQLRDVKEPQKFDAFMGYLESRFLALQSVESKNRNQSSSNERFNQKNRN